MEKVIISFDKYFWTEKENFDKIYKLGKVKNNRIILEPEEVLYLLEKNKAKIKMNDSYIETKEEFISRFYDRINFKVYHVIKYIREIGYYFDLKDNKIIIHAKGERNNPIYLCMPFLEFEELSWGEILEYLEEARRCGCKLLLALIDIELDIVFYEIKDLRI